ncbi:methionine/alanine import family NSS transporter small subunit [Oceanobacillus rekensis]|nr:methionine/alanine import family NSS transporter small subunit [Oceanobacillus rekensis]
MSVGAIIVMIFGIVIIWGGLGTSIWNAIRKTKDAK